MADMIGWVATIIMVGGSLSLANQLLVGWWLLLFGNVLFAASGVISGLTSLVAVSIIMGVLDIYGIYNWKKRSNGNNPSSK